MFVCVHMRARALSLSFFICLIDLYRRIEGIERSQRSITKSGIAGRLGKHSHPTKGVVRIDTTLNKTLSYSHSLSHFYMKERHLFFIFHNSTKFKNRKQKLNTNHTLSTQPLTWFLKLFHCWKYCFKRRTRKGKGRVMLVHVVSILSLFLLGVEAAPWR